MKTVLVNKEQQNGQNNSNKSINKVTTGSQTITTTTMAIESSAQTNPKESEQKEVAAKQESHTNEKPTIYDITNFPATLSSSPSASASQKPNTSPGTQQQPTAPTKSRPKTPIGELNTPLSTDCTACSMTQAEKLSVPESTDLQVQTESDEQPKLTVPPPPPQIQPQSQPQQRVIVKRAFGSSRHKSLTRQTAGDNNTAPTMTLNYKTKFHIKDISPPPPPVVVYKDASSGLKSVLNKKYTGVGPNSERVLLTILHQVFYKQI